MLKEIIKNGHFVLLDEAKDWKDAIKAGVRPLIEDGSVDESYYDKLIESVEKYGPYIVIMPGVAMPHAQVGENGINKTAVAFMKVNKPVVFDEKDPKSYANIFFTLASADSITHLNNMSQISEFLNDTVVKELIAATTRDEIIALSEKYG